MPAYRLTELAADGAIRHHTYSTKPKLQTLQKFVGGYIQPVPHWDTYEGRKAEVYCDEEGLLKNKSINNTATNLWRIALDYNPNTIHRFAYEPTLVGTVIIVQRY